MPSGFYTRTEERKKAFSQINKGRVRSKEFKEKLRQANLGKKKSKRIREKISQSLTGRKLSEETKRKLRLARKGRKPNLGKKHTEETKRKMSLSQKGKKRSEEIRNKISGKNNSNWRGGITPIIKKIRNSLEYRLWREAVFKRDNYQCIWGGKEHGNKLNADHIKSFALFPELRFAIDNGRTLCIECHRKTDTYGGKSNLK